MFVLTRYLAHKKTMMKFTCIGPKYANCTRRFRPNVMNYTVVHKSGWDVVDNLSKTGTGHSSEPGPGVPIAVGTPWGHSRAPKSKRQLLGTQGPRYFSTRLASTCATTENLYVVLGVDPKATHQEIKAAYYNLSMTYHPDKNQNSEAAALKFREITAAYEILGNFLDRKKYDRSIATSSGVGTRRDEADGFRGSYSSNRGKHYNAQVSVHTGRTTVYDFDEWTKLHYGETIARTADRKARYEERQQMNRNADDRDRVDKLIATIGLLLVGFSLFTSSMESYDTPAAIARNDADAKPGPRVAAEE